MSWPLVLLDEVAQRGSGHTPSQKHPEYWNGGIKWVSLADSSSLDRRYIHDTAKKISALGLRHSSAVLHPKGTVIVSRDAGVGKSAILGDEMAVSQHFIAWRCDVLKLDALYLYQWLQAKKPEFERVAAGSTVKTIGLRYFQNLRIALPSIDEQAAVAHLLGTWDSAIETLVRLIASKNRMYSALVSRLIGSSAATDAWPQKSIRDIALRVQRKSDGGDYPLLTISSASGFVRQDERYRRYMAGESAKSYTLLRAGEFAYNKGNSRRYEFGCAYQLEGFKAALVPSIYVSFKFQEAVSDKYMGHLFAADYLKPQLRSLVKTGVRNNGLLNISPEEFMGTMVPVPPLGEQVRIAQALDAAKTEIELLGRRLDAMRAQKRGLMQKLLTGTWRPSASDQATQ